MARNGAVRAARRPGAGATVPEDTTSLMWPRRLYPSMDPTGTGAVRGRVTDPAGDGPRAERPDDRRTGPAEGRLPTGRWGGIGR